MKKTVVGLFAVLMIGISSSAASTGSEIDPRILSAFQKDFASAKNMTWEVKEKLSIVNFLLNDQRFVAWYNSDAELIATARNILYMQLPLTVIKSLEEYYADAWLSEIVEITRNNETFYHLQAERKNKKLLLKAGLTGSISVLKRIK